MTTTEDPNGPRNVMTKQEQDRRCNSTSLLGGSFIIIIKKAGRWGVRAARADRGDD